MHYIPRIAEQTLNRYLRLFPAVAITGPRQSGKSTMLQQSLGTQYQYFSMDDPLLAARLEDDPKTFMSQLGDRVILDEVQKVPELFTWLKLAIDSNRSAYGRFVLTGSSQFSFVKGISESLAGRAGSLTLLPFQFRELPDSARPNAILHGSYPEQVVRNYQGNREWYAAYIENYLERDVRSLYTIGNLRDFRRLVGLLAARTATEVNYSALSRELGITVQTVQKWVSVLEASYIVFLLPPYHNNLGKRIVKRPRLYFHDTGIVCYLTGLRTTEMLENGPLAGQLFENHVVSEVIRDTCHRAADKGLFWYRTNHGLEADLVLEDRATAHTTFIEIKNSASPRPRMGENVARIAAAARSIPATPGHTISSLLLHRGQDNGHLSKDVMMIGYEEFLAGLAD